MASKNIPQLTFPFFQWDFWVLRHFSVHTCHIHGFSFERSQGRSSMRCQRRHVGIHSSWGRKPRLGLGVGMTTEKRKLLICSQFMKVFLSYVSAVMIVWGPCWCILMVYGGLMSDEHSDICFHENDPMFPQKTCKTFPGNLG